MNIRRSIATVGAAGALAAGSLFVASPAQAAPVFTGGLVNVTIVDAVDVVITDVNVGIGAALAVAANVCGANVAVLAADFVQDGSATCENEQTGQEVTITQL